jgi:hypothetical protein
MPSDDLMSLHPASCPACGLVAIGSIERLDAIAYFDSACFDSKDAQLLFRWNGASATFADTMTTVRDAAEWILVTCAAGHEWFAANLTEGQLPPSLPSSVPDTRAIQLDDPE